MATIDNRALEKMASPAKYIFEHLHEAIIRIAPEREKDLKNELAEFNIIYDDTFKWKLDVDPVNKELHISRKVVEVVWSSSYSYYKIYKGAWEQLDPTAIKIIDLKTKPRLKPAINLLVWAYSSWLDEKNGEWPPEFPSPHPVMFTEQPSSESQLISDLSLGALAFMLHHELSHIVLHHDAKAPSVQCENDADHNAMSWIFEKLELNLNDKKIFRGLCCSIALSIITVRDIYKPTPRCYTHPASYDRLTNCLSMYFPPDNDKIWGFVLSILVYHIADSYYKIPEKTYDSFYDAVQDIANQLSIWPSTVFGLKSLAIDDYIPSKEDEAIFNNNGGIAFCARDSRLQNMPVVGANAKHFAKWLHINKPEISVKVDSSPSLALHAHDIWFALVFLASDITLPIFLNLVASYVYDQLKGALHNDKSNVHFSVVYKDGKSSKMKKMNYDGPVDGLKCFLDKNSAKIFFNE